MEDRTPDELKELSIAVATSALNARQLEKSSDRYDQFGSDFQMLLSDVTAADIFRLASLLGDVSASLVEQIAYLVDSPPETVMTYIAQQMLSTPINDGSSGESHTHGEDE